MARTSRAHLKGNVWTGRILSGLIVSFVFFPFTVGFFKPEMSKQGMRDMGYPQSVGMPIGIAFLISTLLYAIPRTCVLGAILMTGYFGGAVAAPVRVNNPKFVVPLLFGMLTWLGIYLRDARLRALLPLQRMVRGDSYRHRSRRPGAPRDCVHTEKGPGRGESRA